MLEVFLALELKVLGALDRPVRLVLPQAVPAPVADFWRGWNNAWNVEISPLSYAPSYDPWRISPHRRPRRRSRAVFFGGGKDSTLVSQIWREADGADAVLLVRGVYSATPGDGRLQALRADAERRMLRPNRDAFGLASACYWTDYPATIHPTAAAARPHLELHTAGALPILLAHGVETAAFCLEWSGFLSPWPDGDPEPQFNKPRSSPEYLASQSRHYRDVLGTPLTITNPGWAVPFSGVMKALVERYPAATRTFVSCPRISTQRWCMTCPKCRSNVFYLLGAGLVDPDYDYSRALTTGERYLTASTASPHSRGQGRNLAWTPEMPVAARFFEERCDNVARIDMTPLRAKLTPAAYEELSRIHAAFGNERLPRSLQVPRTALDRLPRDVAKVLEHAVAPHLEIVDDISDFIDPAGIRQVLPWHLTATLSRGMPPASAAPTAERLQR